MARHADGFGVDGFGGVVGARSRAMLLAPSEANCIPSPASVGALPVRDAFALDAGALKVKSFRLPAAAEGDRPLFALDAAKSIARKRAPTGPRGGQFFALMKQNITSKASRMGLSLQPRQHPC